MKPAFASTLGSVSPLSGSAGATGFALTLTGTGFDAAADNQVVLTDSRGVATAFGSPAASADGLTLTVTATVPAPADLYAVTVKVGAGPASNPKSFTATPTVAAVSPASGPAGATGFALTLTGTGFSATAADNVIAFNGTPLTQSITSATGTALTATVTPPATAAPYTVTVTTRSVLSTSSAAVNFTTTTPVLTGISPQSGAAGAASFTLTLTGTGFDAAADNQVVFTDSTGAATSFGPATAATAGGTTLTVTGTVPVPADLYAVTVKVGAGPASNPKSFTATPTVAAVSPASGPAGATGFALTVSGTGFSATAADNVIAFNGTPLPTQSITSASGTALAATVTLPAAASASNAVTVTTRGQTTPGSVPFATTTPALNGISPPSGSAGATGFTLTLTGTGFDAAADNQVVLTDSRGVATAFGSPAASADGLTLTVTATVPAPADLYAVTVKVGAGPASNPKSFTATPTVAAVSPTSGPAGATGFALTLTGTGFSATATDNVIYFNGTPLTQTVTSVSASGTSLTATVTLPSAAASYTVTVTTRGVPSASSAAVPFVTTTPVLTGISPQSGAAGAAGFTLTLTGTGFDAAADNQVVFTDSTGAATAFGSPAASADGLTLTVTATVPVPADSYAVTVKVGAGPASNPKSFTATPTVAAVSPASGPAGATGFALTVSGTGFSATAADNQVVFTDSTGVATMVGSLTPSSDGKTLSGTITVPSTAPAGNPVYTVTVTTRGVPSTSPTAVTFTTTTSALTGISPQSGAAGAAGFALTLTGTGFSTTGADNQVVFTDKYGVATNFGSNVKSNDGTTLAVGGTLPIPGDHYRVSVRVGAAPASVGLPFTAIPTLTGFASPVANSAPLTTTSGPAGNSITLTLVGIGFSTTAADNVIYFNGTPLTQTVTSVSASGTTLLATVTLPSAAASYTVTVTTRGVPSASPAAVTFVTTAPALTGISPQSGAAGAAGFTLTLTGTGFDAAADNQVVFTDSTGVATNFGPATTATTTAGGTTLTVTGTVPVPADSYAVTVTVGAGPASNPKTFTAYPTVTSASLMTSTASATSTAPAGSSATLTVIGTGFSTTGADNQVVFTDKNGVTVPFGSAVKSSDGTTLTVTGTLPATGDAYTVSVVTRGVASTSSSAVTLAVTPTVASVIPASGPAGATGFTLTVTGTGFSATAADNVIAFNGAPLPTQAITSASGTSLTALVTLPTAAASYPVTVTTRHQTSVTPPNTSTINFTVNASPTLKSVSNAAPLNVANTGASLTLVGTGFTSTSPNTVTFTLSDSTGTPVAGSKPITFGQAMSSDGTTITITGTLPASGTYSITVSNVNGNTGGTSGVGVPFTVGASALAITNITTNSQGTKNQVPATIGAPVTLIVTGTNFTATSNVLTLTDSKNTVTTFGLPTGSNSTDTTSFSVNGTLPALPDRYTVTVKNSNGTATFSPYAINNPVPIITGLFQSDGTTAYTSDVVRQNITIVIKGSGFVLPLVAGPASTGSALTFSFNGVPLVLDPATQVAVSDTQTITVKGLVLPPTAGTISITVTNPAPGGGSSTPAVFTVVNPLVAITSVIDDGTKASQDPAGQTVTLDINGSGFLDATALSFVFNSSDGSITNQSLVVPASSISKKSSLITVANLLLPSTPGTITITANNPAANSIQASTSSGTFTVTAAPITVAPNSAYVGDPAVTALTIKTTGAFLPNTTVTFAPTLVPSSLLSLTVPASTAGSSFLASFPDISGGINTDINAVGTYIVTASQPSASGNPINATTIFAVLPLGPDHLAIPSGLVTRYFAATATSDAQGKKQDGLSLFSAPYDYIDKLVDPITGLSTIITNLNATSLALNTLAHNKFAFWDPDSLNYDVTNTVGTLADTLKLGRGYWGRFSDGSDPTNVVGLVKRGKTALELVNEAVANKTASPVDGANRFIIPLTPGWNMIGDPWAEPEVQTATGVLLQNIQVSDTDVNDQPFLDGLVNAEAQGLVSAIFYRYDSASGKYVTVSGSASASNSLLPYVGYWVHAYRSCNLLVPQP